MCSSLIGCLVSTVLIMMAEALYLTNTSIVIGLVAPMSGDFGFERTASAATIALGHAKEQGLLKDYNVSVIFRDDKCNGKEALGVTAELHYVYQVNVFIGLPCSEAAVDAAKLVSFWNTPWIAYASAEPSLGDVNLYTTLVRLFSPYDRLGNALVKVLNFLKWQKMAIFFSETGECSSSMMAIKAVLNRCNIQLRYLNSLKPIDVNESSVERIFLEMRTKARIILLCGDSKFIAKSFTVATNLNMVLGEYFFVIASQLPPKDVQNPWKEYSTSEYPLTSKMFRHVIQLSIDLMETYNNRSQLLLEEIPKKLAEPPWNYNSSLLNNITGSIYALYLYDAVYLYALFADKLASTKNLDNGSAFLDYGRNFSFEDKMSGRIVIDYKSDRIENYMAWYFPLGSREFKKFLRIPMTKAAAIPIDVDPCADSVDTMLVGNISLVNFPSDTPFCGFENEMCHQASTDTNSILISVVLTLVVLILCCTVLFNTYRRKRYEKEVFMMRWKVKYEDIHVINRSKLSQSTIWKGTDAEAFAMQKMANVLIGQYKGVNAVIKQLHASQIVLTREDLLQLKSMKDLSCENLNQFIGLCLDPDKVCILTVFCSRGSLQDILGDDLVKLDDNFKLSFIGDILKGMEYLHKSSIKHHGRFKSSNVLIDGKWIVKITDWGLEHLRGREYETENQTFTALLWTAPEILRQVLTESSAFPAEWVGTQKGDVYSFAIILHEIIFRRGTFYTDPQMFVKPKTIVMRVRAGECPSFRPLTEFDQDNDVNLLAMMGECWDENPSKRPDFISLKNKFSSLYKSKNLNLIDNMLKMMENYSNNLEVLVEERTTQLLEEKKKTDRLLYSMMPVSVADRLKAGMKVDPISYSEVSIYFSDIVSFTTMAAQSSPLQVVDLLNDLYIMFDDIIMTFAVYKVETIGDAYMVASGVPNPYESHAVEIALMSLSIRQGVAAFKIRHMPEKKLQVRIGAHCGPVVAGVVGLTMPRYCLFGDTVNMASRMESTGEAMKIHLSQPMRDALLKVDCFKISERGQISIKGKGLQTTYWLEGKTE